MGEGVNWESLNRRNEEGVKKRLLQQQLQNALEKIKLTQALKNANPSFLDQKRRDFMLESGATEPTEEELAPFLGQSRNLATQAAAKLGAQNAMPVAGGGFVIPTPGQANEMPTEFAQPTQDITSVVAPTIKGVQPQDLFRGQVAKRMNAYKAMGEKGAKGSVSQQPKIIGMIRKLKAANASREDVVQAIAFEGVEPEDYIDEIGDYQPAPKKGWFGR